ncbi:putative polyhydroxyalkanoic acid system protein [Novosphingobium kunmingense]|uniref:Putative polyhydroxyalkanoic acid system protein n=1 Tax=Novosphingobium kunmingense TaxID=1211806 RepID=A0A2N0HKC4_9SPHN|nr:polyhydroxyalkanoic acid system family protein [Novosphingobium kunmingense]PKB19402.1 putative polyhydroxyalkanoic acid system protein [Novosphingobium kunmingense]
MRVPISHSLDKEEVRRRLRARTGEIASFIPGGMADVSADWPDEDTMALSVSAMGKTIDGRIEIEDGQVVFTVDFPPALSFVEGMVRGQIEAKGRKLLN